MYIEIFSRHLFRHPPKCSCDLTCQWHTIREHIYLHSCDCFFRIRCWWTFDFGFDDGLATIEMHYFGWWRTHWHWVRFQCFERRKVAKFVQFSKNKLLTTINFNTISHIPRYFYIFHYTFRSTLVLFFNLKKKRRKKEKLHNASFPHNVHSLSCIFLTRFTFLAAIDCFGVLWKIVVARGLPLSLPILILFHFLFQLHRQQHYSICECGLC